MTADEGLIPKRIHQMWVGSNIPEHIATYMASWRRHHPDWEIWVWGHEDLSRVALKNQHLYDDALSIAPKAPYQFQADVVRYELLAAFGGVWVDADFECQHAIDDLVEGLMPGTGWLAWEVEGKWLNNAIMAMPQKHSLMEDAIRNLPINVQLQAPATNTILSGPQYITPLAMTTADPVVFMPKGYFFPYLWNELYRGRDEFPDSYAVHHWNNRRVRNGKPR